MADIKKLEEHLYLVDGVRRVGPGVAYAIYSVSLIDRAENAVQADRLTLSADDLNAVAHGALHVAATALTVDDPMRHEIIGLLRKMETRR